MPGVTVRFATTLGTLKSKIEITDNNGEASTELISATSDGTALVTATSFVTNFVEVEFKQENSTISVRIHDQGNGFDYKKYLDFDPDRIFDLHGRGIAIAKNHCFDSLEYIGAGNEVLVQSSSRV